MSSVNTCLAIIGGALASEDLAAVSAGLLVREARLTWIAGLTVCFLAIFLSDLAVWSLGRVAAVSADRFAWSRRRLADPRVASFGDRLGREGLPLMLAVRFVPSARVPLHFAAGVVGMPFGRYVLYGSIAAAVWTPLVVGATVIFGTVAAGGLDSVAIGSSGWMSAAIVIAAAAWFARKRPADEFAAARLGAAVARLWHWEYWPTWFFYLPLAPKLAWLALRYRSCTVWTAANPAVPAGGVVGESKFEILRHLPVESTLRSLHLSNEPSSDGSAAPSEDRIAVLARAIAAGEFTFPLILKPDASQRGAGVRLVRTLDEAVDYLRANEYPIIAQAYHSGPFEAGIFYYRMPGELRGHVFSITDKVFPEVVGDGSSSLEQLVWRHPRHRMQAARFLARFADARNRVPAAGECVRLAMAGNHCQGTMFLDGTHLLTPELERRIDEIARSFPGFYVGRFDVRYSDPAAFRSGDGLAIVELNGVTSESTNLYDPRHSLGEAYRILARQWEILFAIGHANRRRGIQVTGSFELLSLVRRHLRTAKANPVSD
jgi:membrane protein DedA with SNARE-associated domain